MDSPFELIQTPEALARGIDRWRAAPWLAVDTEFVREETYFAQLCLVQVCDGGTPALVDVLALDPAPLLAFLCAPAAVKVLHSAGQDLELFVQRGGDCPRPLFDTQVAAALLGHGEQLGYAALVERRLGVAVDKSLSRTDWSRRPLPAAALAYAADDVRHLAELYPPLRRELEARGRLGWLEAECERLADPRRYRPDPAGAWRGLRGLGRLAPAAQHLGARLAAWREDEAIRRDRPRRWILDDDALCRIAAQRPADAAALARIEGVASRFVQRNGEALLALLAEPPAAAAPLLAEPRDTPEQKRKVRELLETLRSHAAAGQVAPTLVATRGDVERLVREGASAPIPLLRGWRREFAGEALLAKLESPARAES